VEKDARERRDRNARLRGRRFRVHPLYIARQQDGWAIRSRHYVDVRVVLLRMAVLEADIDSQQLHFSRQLLLNLADDLPDGVLLLNVEIVKRRDVSGWHNQDVESGDWMRIGHGRRQLI
jgi:hypothetical protein